jgi:hypothetical protein
MYVMMSCPIIITTLAIFIFFKIISYMFCTVLIFLDTHLPCQIYGKPVVDYLQYHGIFRSVFYSSILFIRNIVMDNLI